MKIFVDYQKLADAARYVYKHNKTKKATKYEFLRDLGVYGHLDHLYTTRRKRCPKQPRDPCINTLNNIFDKLKLVPERYLYVAEQERPKQPFNPDLDLLAGSIRGDPVDIVRIDREARIEFYKKQLGDKLATTDYVVLTFDQFLDLASALADLIKDRCPKIRVDIVIPNNIKNRINIVCTINKFLHINIHLKYEASGKVLTCMSIFNEISEEDCLTDTAYDILTPVKIIQFINILKREVNIYRKV